MATAKTSDETVRSLRRTRLEAVLGRIRPLLRADGIDVALIDLRGDGARVRLMGQHSACGGGPLTLHSGLSEALRDEIPDFGELEIVADPQPWELLRSGQVGDSAPYDPPRAAMGASAAPSVVVGQSTRMRAVFEYVRAISDSDSTVLIIGETGTGKEVTATSIHDSSRRRQKPFVAVSCAVFSEELIESELFGHERGAFTGAIRDRPGRFELADGGTLFLDDIDDVPLAMQVKLLRVLQNRTIERVGGTRTIPVNVRILAGTKTDLRHLVSDGAFREDLYYRLNVLPLVLPPLRERREDIPALMDHFLAHYCSRRGEGVPDIPPALRDAFLRYRWPGNVRELEHACERIAQTCTCGTLHAGCISMTILSEAAKEPPRQEPVPAVASEDVMPIPLDDRLREVEAALIKWALETSHGNKSKAAELLRIKRSTLGGRIHRCHLEDRVANPSRRHKVA